MPPVIRMILQLGHVFEELGVLYYLGGSVASSIYGVTRATIDADLVARLLPVHVPGLVRTLGDYYYIDSASVVEAIARGTSFNLIHLEEMEKTDVFVPLPSPWADEQMARRRRLALAPGQLAYVASAEDVVLHKLLWYQMGGGLSDRQWYDILGVLKTQGQALDLAYMARWAAEIGVGDLLPRATEQAGGFS